LFVTSQENAAADDESAAAFPLLLRFLERGGP